MNDLHRERLARLALSRLGEPGDPKILDLVAELGPIGLHEGLLAQRDLAGMKDDVAVRLEGLDPAADLERGARLGIRYVIPGDDEWPTSIDSLEHAGEVAARGGAPLGLWVKGPLRLNELSDSVAIVGSRSSTTYGAEVATDLAGTLASSGKCVVSGAAFGIDQAAHRGALSAKGKTVAVLACGADRVYPVAHANLIRYIGDHGAVVSELAPGCSPTRLRFLARNRIIAALSLGTVVVEAAVRSGALNTANWTQRLSRPLMAVPGPVNSGSSEGAHQLIRTGSANLVTRGEDVLEILGTSGEHLLAEPRAPERPRDALRLPEAQVLDAVPASREVHADSIARTAGMGLIAVRRALRNLQEGGFVARGEQGWQLTEHARS